MRNRNNHNNLNNRFIKVLFSLFSILYVQYTTAQNNGNVKPKIIRQTEYISLENRMTTFKKSIYIADSMYVTYLDTHFYLETSDPKILSDGLIWIKKLYTMAQTFRPKSKYCKELIVRIDEQCKQELAEEEERQYRKILEAAEKKLAEGNIDKAIELLKRAIAIKPTDDYPKKRLDEIRVLYGIKE